MQDAAGGLVATMASERDYFSPPWQVAGEVLQSRDGVPTVDRVRAFKLIEDLTASEFAGCICHVHQCGGASQPIRCGWHGIRH